MNFLPTEYIYPLHEPISLSIKLKLYLDNPRTDEEISLVEEYIREAYKNDSAFRFSEESLYEELQQSLVFLGQESKYVANFAMLHSQRDFYGLLARMWIVARYDDEGTHAELKTATIELREKGDVGFFLLEDDHPIISNSRKLTEFCHLISLLIHTQLDEYYGRSLLLEYDSHWSQEMKVSHFPCMSFFLYLVFASRPTNTTDESRWLYFPIIIEAILKSVELIDSAIDKGLIDKIMYIASLLKVAGNDIEDEKAKLVTLVSIIELLVTHSPDFSRFNIEDSINKQFQLKAATLIYLNDKKRDINQIRSRLKEIYSLRSSIAHGDFQAINKYIQNAQKDDEKYPIIALIGELYTYLRAIIIEYLKDHTFVDFLKSS